MSQKDIGAWLRPDQPAAAFSKRSQFETGGIVRRDLLPGRHGRPPPPNVL